MKLSDNEPYVNDENSTTTDQDYTPVTPWGPVERKQHLDQFSSATVAQNAMSDLEYRAYSIVNYTNRTCRTITAIRASVGQNKKDANGKLVPARRSRLSIAAHLQINSDDDDYKRRFVSKAVAAMLQDFARCGRKVITVIAGDGRSPQFTLETEEALERADATRRIHPEWRTSSEARIQATEDAALWLATQFPAADPLPEKEEGKPLNDREYTERLVASLRRLVDSGLDHLEEITSEARVRAVQNELRRELEGIFRSREKTLPARRPLNSTVSTGEEGEPPNENDTPSYASLPPVEDGVSFLDLEEIENDAENYTDSGGGGVSKSTGVPPPNSNVINNDILESPKGAELNERLEWARQSVYVWTSRGYREFFFRLEDALHKTMRNVRYTASEALAELPSWLDQCDEGKWSFMPRPAYQALIKDMTPDEKAADDVAIYPRPLHLDDLDETKLAKVGSWAHWTFETSPGNYQTVVFVTCDKPTAVVLRKRLVKGVASDKGANGSFRWPGSRNWKPKHGGSDVRLDLATFADSWKPAELEESGLLSAPELPRPPLKPVKLENYYPMNLNGALDWAECEAESLASGARGKDGGPNHSDVDWRYMCRAYRLNISPLDVIEEVTRRRKEITPEKLQKSPDYVRYSVSKAYGVTLDELSIHSQLTSN